MNKEELNELLKIINRNMDNYNKDITLRMEISDSLERKTLKRSAEQLCKELYEESHPFSLEESFDFLIEESKISEKKKVKKKTLLKK